MFAGEIQKQKALFAVVDAGALVCAFRVTLALHDPSASLRTELFGTTSRLFGLGPPAVIGLWLLLFRAFDLYRIRSGGWTECVAVTKACAVSILLTVFAAYCAHVQPARITTMLALLWSILAVLSGRALLRRCIRRFYANPQIAIPLVIVGFNPIAQYVFDQILNETTQYEVLGFLDDGAVNQQYRGYSVLGGLEQLAELSAAYPCLEAAIAIPAARRKRQEEVIATCEKYRIRWSIVPWLYRSVASGLKVGLVGTLALIGPAGSNVEGINFALKRLFDIAVTAPLLILAAPIIGLAASAVWLFDGRPMFIRQTRIGVRGLPFELLKLRTMRVGASDTAHREYVKEWVGNSNGGARNERVADGSMFKLVDDDRVTKVGRILRRFSIDELPQLINVVRGEMSLIGPRPALPYELELYHARHRRRLEAVPGMTGLWQVSGRNRVSFDDMVRLDVRYLEEWSLGNDVKILVRTLPILIRGEGL